MTAGIRILVVSQYFWPETFRINDIAADLVNRGHQVTVLTGTPNYPEGRILLEYKRNPAQFSSYHGAEIVRVPIIPRGKSSLLLLLNYISFVASGATIGAKKLSGRSFDAILVYQVSPVTSAIPALLQRRLKKAPLAMWILDLWPETLSAVGIVKWPRALRLVGKVVDAIYRRSDCLLVQSKAFIPAVGERAGPQTPIHYFPAWAEEMFSESLETVEAAPELAPFKNTFNVMFAGNIGEAQDFPAILAGAEKLKDRADIRWLIVGDGRAAPGVAAEIAARGLGDRVHLLGRHPPEDMPRFFKGAHALLASLRPNPAFAMTIPGKIQNYLRSGLPVVAMIDGEGARVVEEAGAGYTCRAGDSVGLAEIVRKLADTSAEEREKMGARGKAYCIRDFDRETLLVRLDAWLRGMAIQCRQVQPGIGGHPKAAPKTETR